MAFAGVSLIVDGKLCPYTESPVDACSDSGYHLLVVQGYTRTTKDTPKGECIKSRPFIVGGHRWILSLYPNGEPKSEKDQSMTVLLYLCEDMQPVLAQYSFSYIDQTDLQVPTLLKSRDAYDFSISEGAYSHRLSKAILERSRHLKNDSFTFRCDIVVVTNAERAASAPTAPPFIQAPPPKMDTHFGDLLRTKEGTDITFEVGGEKFAAHRCALAARSTVFKAQIFGNGILEAGATVKIDDMEAQVFRSMLIFIYTDALPRIVLEDEGDEEEGNSTGKDESEEEAETETDKAETDEEEAETETDEAETHEEEAETEEDEAETQEVVMGRVHLLEAADRYDLQGLKMSCEESLARFIRVSTVADIIVAAEQRQCRWLKEVCLEFIRSHTSLHTVFTPEDFEQMIRTCSTSSLKRLISKFVS